MRHKLTILLTLVLVLIFLKSDAQVLLTAKYQGKYGLIDTSGEWHLKPQYDSMGAFFHQSTHYCVNGKFGLISHDGRLISPPAWQEVSYEEEGLIAVFNGEYWGYLDLAGKTVVEPQFFDADDFHEGWAGASKLDDNWGFIDRSGKWVIAPQFTFVMEFNNGKALVEDEDGVYYINRQGNRLSDDSIPGSNLSRFQAPNGKVGIQRMDSSFLIQPRYDNLSLRSRNTYFFLDKGYWGLMDTSGKVLYPAKFESFAYFSDGLAPVKLQGKWGYINRQGAVVIPCIFEEARYFSYNRAAVKFDGKWGLINLSGNFIVAPKFDKVLGKFQPVDPVEYHQLELDHD